MEKAEYLRKYLGIGRIKKTKKKKEIQAVGRGLRIIDDDAVFGTTMNDEQEGLEEDADEKPIVIESPERQINTKLTTKNWVEHSDINSKNDEKKGRKERHDSSSSDTSPLRRPPSSAKALDVDLSPPRKKLVRHDSDSDMSPPRKQTNLSKDPKDTDLSPTRKFKNTDLSPPRKSKNISLKKENIKKENLFIKKEADAPDQSPPRKRRQRHGSSSSDNSPPRSSKQSMPVKRDVRNIEVISRHNNEKEESLKTKRKQKEEEEAKKEALSSKYKQWGRGLVQQERSKEMLEDMALEVSKPMARYEDDDDLNEMRKNRLLKEDPMYDLMNKKQQAESGKTKKLTYKGPQPHPNRYNIDPGYRWDGVDRSNGFEKDFFKHASNRKAVKDIAYKYMTEDM